MASKQRVRISKKENTTNPFADIGIFNISDIDVMDEDNESDNDENALESELEAILSCKIVTKSPQSKKKVASSLDIETMAAECMKDDEDEDEDSLLADQDLLKELKDLSCEIPEEESISSSVEIHSDIEMPQMKEVPIPSRHSPKISPGITIALLEERLNLYNDAIDAAKKLNENSKIRRYTRAQKTLHQLIKFTKAGKNINEEDIPPVVNIKAKARPPPKPDLLKPEYSSSTLPTSSDVTGNLIDISSDILDAETQKIEKVDPNITDLIRKRDEYKIAALKAKRAGDKTIALSYMKTLKNLDAILEAVKNGEEIDLSNLPAFPSPSVMIMPMSDLPKKELDETQTSSLEVAALSAASEPEDPTLFNAPPAPTSVLEALNQRLEKFKGSKESAETEGNCSKVRRLDRIIKTYEKAIKDHKAGRPINFEELPAPPGFGPIPVPERSEKPKPADISIASGNLMENKEVLPALSKKPAPNVSLKKIAPEMPSKKVIPEVRQKSKAQRANSSTVEKQLQFLLERQKMFRQAAITAKKNGDIEQAKHYLKLSKGFNNMIEASRCGLPVDISTIPTPPQLESDFVIVDIQDCVEDDGTSLELFESLENDLSNQIEVCNRNRDHFLKLGDISAASKFEKLGLESRKDLSLIHHLKKTGQSPPKFHYETRLFCIVQYNTHLSDSELEIIVERGINLPGKPDDLDSYVKIEFPIPSDCPQKARSRTIRDTNNPIFQEEFKFHINRKSRSQLRQFKRGTLKLEVWSKGGFLRSDSLIGTVSVKLANLESRCTIHDSFDLMDGRKTCGGKLEVKVRIRNPLVANQVEEVKEKWLVIGA